MGNFWLFQQTSCEVIVKYTKCNLLEHEWIRTLEAEIDEKNKNIGARQNVTDSYKKKECSFWFTERFREYWMSMLTGCEFNWLHIMDNCNQGYKKLYCKKTKVKIQKTIFL